MPRSMIPGAHAIGRSASRRNPHSPSPACTDCCSGSRSSRRAHAAAWLGDARWRSASSRVIRSMPSWSASRCCRSCRTLRIGRGSGVRRRRPVARCGIVALARVRGPPASRRGGHDPVRDAIGGSRIDRARRAADDRVDRTRRGRRGRVLRRSIDAPISDERGVADRRHDGRGTARADRSWSGVDGRRTRLGRPPSPIRFRSAISSRSTIANRSTGWPSTRNRGCSPPPRSRRQTSRWWPPPRGRWGSTRPRRTTPKRPASW